LKASSISEHIYVAPFEDHWINSRTTNSPVDKFQLEHTSRFFTPTNKDEKMQAFRKKSNLRGQNESDE